MSSLEKALIQHLAERSEESFDLTSVPLAPPPHLEEVQAVQPLVPEPVPGK